MTLVAKTLATPVADPLFFVAIVPPETISAEITGFKNYIYDNWGPKHALKSPPHITLLPPFRLSQEEVPSLIRLLTNFAASQTPFEVELQDFNAFPPRVIFVHPLPNSRLEQLFRELTQAMEAQADYHDSHKDRPYKAHLTVAHRDLDATTYPRVWAYFRKITYYRKFRADAIVLLKQVGGKWEVWQRFAFGDAEKPLP